MVHRVSARVVIQGADVTKDGRPLSGEGGRDKRRPLSLPREEGGDSSGRPETLGAFLSTAAARFGPNPALSIKPTFRTLSTTYEELEQLARRTGRMLQERGVRKGDRVLIWAPNTPAWVVAFFGCQKIGAVTVPLDVRTSPSFAASIVLQTEPAIAFLSRQTAAQSEALGVRAILLEELESALPETEQLVEEPAISPSDLAEIMFTSGTTGDPKGVMLTHANILSNVAAVHEVVEIKPRFRLLSMLPLSHMLEQNAGLLAPLSGGCRIVYPTSRQPSLLFRTIAKQRISMLVLVPQALQLFLNAIEREAKRAGREAAFKRSQSLADHLTIRTRRLLFRGVHRRIGGKLDLVVCGGAYLDPALAQAWERMGVMVLQGYGATEAAPIISGDGPRARKVGAVGRAFPGVDVRIAPDGEILGKGPNIFVGYWNNRAASEAALKEGWYHTGDLGAIDADGFLHLRGRKKDLIVLANGQNVFPEDIETALVRQTGVRDAVVLGLERQGGTIQVHAVVLLEEGTDADGAVRAANAGLADHQRIQGVTIWPDEDFPRTHTLKVKKQEVLERLAELVDSASAAHASTGAVDGTDPAPSIAESLSPRLRAIIAETSRLPMSEIAPERSLGAELNFDSLSRVELLSAIEEELGVYVDETRVTPVTTVAQLEQLVEQSTARTAANRLVSWPFGRTATIARELLLQLLCFPFYHLFWHARVDGLEELRDAEGPFMIVCNHHFAAGELGMEPAAIGMALPRALRMNSCTAGEEHAVFDRPVRGFLARLCNAFPLSKEGNVRGTLEYIGALLDRGKSVLIFPEGNLFDGGPLHPFMGGTGMIAVECRVPVLPTWIEIERRNRMQRGGTALRGAYSVRIGAPIAFPLATSYDEATEQIEAAVRELAQAAAQHA